MEAELLTKLLGGGAATAAVGVIIFLVRSGVISINKNGKSNGNGHVDFTPILEKIDEAKKEVTEKIDDIAKEVSELKGRFDTRERSDEGYHKAIVDNHKELSREVHVIKSDVDALKERNRLKDLGKLKMQNV